MRKNADTGSSTERITRVAADEAIESRTDWARVHATTPEEIEAQAAQDEAEDGMVVDWDSVTVSRPAPKAVLHMRVDQDVLDFFKQEGRGYQTKINAVLRAYKEAQGRRG